MLQFMVFLSLIPVSVFSEVTDNLIHIGCFNANSSTSSHHGKVVKPLTWEICAHLCRNKVTMYAGMQSSKHTCFCGNDMKEQSTVEDQSRCQPCHEDTSRWCGGEDTLSLYQLKPSESTLLGILLATDSGIKMVTTEGFINSSETLELSETSATSIGYNYKNEEIYFVSKNKIWKLSYIPLLLKYIHPQEISTGFDCDSRSDLDIDWVNNLVYWACGSGSSITKANLDGKSGKTIIINATGLKHVKVEPYARLIFFTRSMTLSKYNFSVFKENILNKEYNFGKVVQLAIDIQQEVIYIIGSYSDESKRYLVSLNYNCTVFKVIYTGSEITNPFGLDAFNGSLVWGITVNNSSVLYRGKVSVKGHLEKVTVIYFGTEKINDLKIYHPEAQRPGTDYLCQKKNCSHSCSVVSSVTVQCSCSTSTSTNFTTILANDSRTCIDIPNYSLLTTKSVLSTSDSLFTKDMSSGPDESTLTHDSTRSEDFDFLFKTEKSYTTDTNITMPMQNGHFLMGAQFSTVPLNKESNSLLYITFIGLTLILVVVIPLQVYLAIWLRRTNRTFDPLILYNRSSELVNLT